jgi:hypothetical protein
MLSFSFSAVKTSFGLMVLKSFIMSSMPVRLPSQMINTSSTRLKYATFSYCGKMWNISLYPRYCGKVYSKNSDVGVPTGKHILVDTTKICLSLKAFCFND